MLRAAIRAEKAYEASHWTLQYVSGLLADEGWHRAWSALIPRAGQHLALLGNCCSVATELRATQTEEFLRRCSATWDTVSIVPGPRELSSESGAPYYDQLDRLRELAKTASAGMANIHIMDQGELPFFEQGVILFGAGGWTAIHPHTMQGMPSEPIWYTPSQRLTTDHLATWHNEDWDWMYARHNWWAMHHPNMKRILCTYSLCTHHLISTEEREMAIYPMTFPYATNKWILNHPHIPYPYAWLCGAGKGSVSGNLVRNIFHIAVNSADPNNTNYLPNRILAVPLA